ncbi:hypothetical protein [Sphingopyxis panaciterrae]
MMDAIKQEMQWSNIVVAAVLILTSATACSEAPTVKTDGPIVELSADPPKPKREKKLIRADRGALQERATAACECAVAKGKDCWNGYKTAIKPFLPEGQDGQVGMASACAPVSTEVDCLEDAEGEFCVTTGYDVNGVQLDNRQLCKQAEARAIDNAFSDVMKKAGPGGDWDQKEAQTAAKKALAAVRAGKASKAPPSSGGCV